MTPARGSLGPEYAIHSPRLVAGVFSRPVEPILSASSAEQPTRSLFQLRPGSTLAGKKRRARMAQEPFSQGHSYLGYPLFQPR